MPPESPKTPGSQPPKTTLNGAAAKAGRFFSRLRQEYRAGLAGEVHQPQPASRPQTPPQTAQRRINARPWWEVLGVRDTATPEEITAAYRELLRKTHPDKVAQLSDRLRQVAEEETQQLNAAYEEARRAVAQRKGP